MSNLIGVKEAAELLGVSTKTIRRWEADGKIRSTRTEGGHRRFNVSDLLGNKFDASLTVAYARVSSHDQKQDLDRQAMVLEAYCAKQGWSFELIKDLGSGMNYKKKGLIRLIKLLCTIPLFHQSRQKNNKSHPKDRPSNANNQSHLFWQ